MGRVRSLLLFRARRSTRQVDHNVAGKNNRSKGFRRHKCSKLTMNVGVVVTQEFSHVGIL